jgi:hypothetical protein
MCGHGGIGGVRQWMGRGAERGSTDRVAWVLYNCRMQLVFSTAVHCMMY